MPGCIAALLAAMSWSEAYVVLGVASFVIAGPALLVVREAPPVAGARRPRPHGAGEGGGKGTTPLAPTLSDEAPSQPS